MSKIPFCAFNGGNDVFVDVGNKSLGLQALMKFMAVKPHEVMSSAAEREGHTIAAGGTELLRMLLFSLPATPTP